MEPQRTLVVLLGGRWSDGGGVSMFRGASSRRMPEVGDAFVEQPVSHIDPRSAVF